MSEWLFSLDDGAVPRVITDQVEIPSITRERRIHTQLKANVNVCTFRCRFSSTLWTYLISAGSIQISITKDSAAYFSGYVSPNFEATIRDGQKYIEIRVEDYSLKKLGQTISVPLICLGYAVCNPAAPAASLVHVIAAAAGVTVSPTVPTIADIVPYVIVLPEDNTDHATLLGDILFEHRHVCTFLEPGLLDVVPYVNSGAVTSVGLLSTAAGTRNLRGELVQRKIAEKYDDIRVSYSEVSLKTGIVLFQDTDGATGSLACNIELAASGDADGKDYYPKTADDGEVFASWNSPDGYDIWVATSAAMDVLQGSGIVVQRALTNYYRRCSFGYRNTAAAARAITKMRITGNAYVRTSENTARFAEPGAADLFEYECSYVFTKEAAQALAAAIAQYYRYADLTYTAKSKDAFALGAYVTVEDPVYSGISALCRIAGITESEKQPGLYTYALEGAADFESVDIVIEGSATPPSTPNIGGQTPQEVATAIDLASKSLALSTSAVSRSRAGTIAPAAITGRAYSADGSVYPGRFTVELSHNGGVTYQAPVYTSEEDESSHAYTVPATMDVEGTTYYVTGGRVRLHAAGGVTTRIGEALFTVSMDLSLAAKYLGIGILSSLTTGPYASATVASDGTITTGPAVATVVAGDMMVNYSAAGGVAVLGLYKWSGTAWVRTTDLKDLTFAMNDLFGLSVAGIAIADATIVSLLIAKQILAENVDVTGQLTIRAGGRMRYETGAGVQKRCVHLADEKVDFLDIPDTTPASAEQLRFRLGRLGVGNAVLADGELLAPIEAPWSDECETGVTANPYDTDQLIDKDGLAHLFYLSSSGACERIKVASAWGDEIVIDSAATGHLTACNLPDGTISLIYNRSGNAIYECIKDSLWGTPVPTGLTGTYPRQFVQRNGTRRLISNANPFSPRESIYASGWGAFSDPISSEAYRPNYVEVGDDLYLIYRKYPSTTGIVWRKLIGGSAYDGEEVIMSGTISFEPFAISTLDDRVYLSYISAASYYTINVYENGTWGLPQQLWGNAQGNPTIAQDQHGNLIAAYVRLSDSFTIERTLQRYAQVGAGIISDTNNGTTRYLDFSNRVRLAFPVGGGSVVASIL